MICKHITSEPHLLAQTLAGLAGCMVVSVVKGGMATDDTGREYYSHIAFTIFYNVPTIVAEAVAVTSPPVEPAPNPYDHRSKAAKGRGK